MSPETTPLQTIGAFAGSAKLTVTVEKSDGSPAVGSLVVVVYPPTLPLVAGMDYSDYGPIRAAVTDRKGQVEWRDLSEGSQICVHARSGATSDILTKMRLYPPAIGTFLSETAGARDQTPVISGPGGTSVPFSPDEYLTNCVSSPPVLITTGANKVTLQHGQAAPAAVQVLDLLGVPRTDVQRGIVTLVGQCEDPDGAGYIPWLAAACDPEAPPGYLQSYTSANNGLGYSYNTFRIEALDNILIPAKNGKPVDIVASQGYESFTQTTEQLLGENLVCNANEDVRGDDGLGDAPALDIEWYKYSIGVGTAGDVLYPDPSRTTVWWTMTPGTGDVDYTSRTVYEGSNSTVTNFVRFSVARQGSKYVCSTPTSSGNEYLAAEVYCEPYLDPTNGPMIKVSLIERDVDPAHTPAWTSKEFNLKTQTTGGGDSTWNPDRSGASRAYTPFSRSDTCTLEGGNDPRIDVRL